MGSVSRCTALFFAGRADESLELVDLAMEAVPQVPLQVAARAGAYRGRILLFQGRAGSASRRLTDAALSVRANQGVYPSWCLALAAESHALLGHHEEAREAATEAVILDRSEIQAYRPDQLRALAWVDAQSGRISSATDQLWAAADLAASRGQRSFEIIILDDLLRLGEHEAAGRTRELAVHVDGAWSAAIASHADAVLSGATVDLETAAEAFRGIGARLVAAELWATASAARQREGLTARATEAARHAKELSERCEGARTQPLEWAVADVPLTRRERETATLAANGATNAEIAAELTVSERTVESHLYAVFAKLGITNRNQLTGALQDG